MDDVEALEFAIKVEKAGLKSYLEFARKSRDITGKNMFISLAKDEFAHMEILEKELNNIREKKGWEKVDIPESEVEKLIPVLDSIQKKKGKSGMQEIDALEMALEQEERSMRFYREQKEKVKDPVARKILEKLGEMELSHYLLIQSELDYIRNTGFWFDIPEFSLEVSQ
jgi:rubrerythrin